MDVNKVYKKYYKNNLWIIAGLYLIGLLVVQLTQQNGLYQFADYQCCLLTYHLFYLWRSMESDSQSIAHGYDNFYLAGSGFRMLLAFLTVVVYAMVVKERAW